MAQVPIDSKHLSDWLDSVGRTLVAGGQWRLSAREILTALRAEHRDFDTVEYVSAAIRKAGLSLSPALGEAHIDTPLEFSFAVKGTGHDSATGGARQGRVDTGESKHVAESYPASRLGRAAAAWRKPVPISPNARVAEAVTRMVLEGVENLVVMSGTRDPKGIISWKSIVNRLSVAPIGLVVENLGAQLPTDLVMQAEVRTLMEQDVKLLSATDSLKEAEEVIHRAGYVLVRDASKQIVGLVTANDLAAHYRELTEPFLLIGEIEVRLRVLLEDRISIEEMTKAVNPADKARTVESLKDLTLGELVRLLEDPARWSRIFANVDRGQSLRRLMEILAIRNRIMHFDPDPIAGSQMDVLRSSVERLLPMLEEHARHRDGDGAGTNDG